MSFVLSRLKFIRKSYSTRVVRLVAHLSFSKSRYLHRSSRWYYWPLDLVFYLIDLLIITDVLDVLLSANKKKRTLSDQELKVCTAIFRSSIDADQIKIIEHCHPIRKDMFFAFVSFNTVHCVSQIPMDVLVHEIMHVWQYQRFGSVYIFRALKAQRSANGYDYCGLGGLMEKLKSDNGLLEFNFEQQAEIIEDYFKLSMNSYVELGNQKIYEHFVKQLEYNSTPNVA